MNTDKAESRGYAAGRNGYASTPHDFMYSEIQRSAYERAYDIGRKTRLDALRISQS